MLYQWKQQPVFEICDHSSNPSSILKFSTSFFKDNNYIVICSILKFSNSFFRDNNYIVICMTVISLTVYNNTAHVCRHESFHIKMHVMIDVANKIHLPVTFNR